MADRMYSQIFHHLVDPRLYYTEHDVQKLILELNKVSNIDVTLWQSWCGKLFKCQINEVVRYYLLGKLGNDETNYFWKFRNKQTTMEFKATTVYNFVRKLNSFNFNFIQTRAT